jgi:hypothetical protein
LNDSLVRTHNPVAGLDFMHDKPSNYGTKG